MDKLSTFLHNVNRKYLIINPGANFLFKGHLSMASMNFELTRIEQ